MSEYIWILAVLVLGIIFAADRYITSTMTPEQICADQRIRSDFCKALQESK